MSQPASQSVLVGQTATFSILASGSAPLAYQWTKDGAAISGANEPSYTTPPATTADSGAQVAILISNVAGSVTSASATLIVNDPAKITPTITWDDPAAISYGTALGATQLNAVANVPGTFVYTPPTGTVLNAGTQTLHVDFTPDDPATYNLAAKDAQITVSKITPMVTWANPADIDYGTTLGAAQLNATADVPGKFAYTPAAGTVLSAGTQTLHVAFTPDDELNYGPASKGVQINVAKATPAITWASPAGITYGTALGAAQLNATANVPGTFVYTPPVGTVLTVGTQTLHAAFTPNDAANYNAASQDVQIAVTKATPTITWANPSGITYGTELGAAQLNATASAAGTFVYTPAAGTVLNAGTETLHVEFTPADSANYLPAAQDVQLVVAKATPMIAWTAPANIDYGTALGAAQLNATASVAGTFVYAPAPGTVLNAGVWALHADFTPSDAANYKSASQEVQISINKLASTIGWNNPADISYGTALSAVQLSATASVPGTFVYTPGVGTVLDAGTRTLHVEFTPGDATNYFSAAKDVQIVVLKVTPAISWANPADINYGTALGAAQLNATASAAGTFVYTPAAGTVLNAGTQTLHVEFTPDDAVNYNAAAKDVQITVSKATPTINWANPGDISYGTALDATQLNATASVPGTFVYTPAAGTVLSVGTYPLHVDFTPDDAADYHPASKEVQIHVA
jgi:hypothetical protein